MNLPSLTDGLVDPRPGGFLNLFSFQILSRLKWIQILSQTKLKLNIGRFGGNKHCYPRLMLIWVDLCELSQGEYLVICR